MGSGIYGIGVSALQNSQLGLATTGHNIANANTEGYNRQRIIQASNIATLTGSGYVGSGAHVVTIERIYSSFLAKQVSTAQTSVSSLEVYSSSLGELNNLLSSSDSGIETALEDFFAGINQVTSDPASLTTRQTMVSSAQVLAARFQGLDAQIDGQYQSVDSQLKSYVGSINTFARQIATLNKQIINAEAINGQPPNDLYDQRDLLISDLNKLVGVQTTTNTNGSVNVFFGHGQPLVVGGTASSLAAVPSSADPSRLAVGIVNAAGTQELPESVLSGGALTGILQYRAESLDKAANALGQIAASVALTLNAQHALGQNLLGQISGDSGFVADFFKLGTPRVVANTNNPTGAATVTAAFSAPTYNDGQFSTNLTASDYRLNYDGSTMQLTRLSDNVSWSASSVAALNTSIAGEGFSLSASGSFVAGSSYLIQPTRDAAQNISVNELVSADVRQIAVAAPVLASAGTSNVGTASISSGSVAPGYTAPTTGSPVTLTYNSSSGGFTGFSSYPVTVNVDGVETSYASGTVPYTSGATISFAGMSFTVTGSPSDGDTFTVARNVNGVSDNRNALLMAQMQTGKTMAGGTASFSTVYAQMVSDAGNQGSEAETVLAARKTMLKQAETARNSVSGVNLDEEAVHLIEYQQAYQASARMLQIASQLFDSILAIG